MFGGGIPGKSNIANTYLRLPQILITFEELRKNFTLTIRNRLYHTGKFPFSAVCGSSCRCNSSPSRYVSNRRPFCPANNSFYIRPDALVTTLCNRSPCNCTLKRNVVRSSRIHYGDVKRALCTPTEHVSEIRFYNNPLVSSRRRAEQRKHRSIFPRFRHQAVNFQRVRVYFIRAPRFAFVH